ncbi:MAG: late competence development ComFB family protein [Oscillospiraceae bacterium]|nr:late competence development ComFB family protein [Oscillospiraceae bacterium]
MAKKSKLGIDKEAMFSKIMPSSVKIEDDTEDVAPPPIVSQVATVISPPKQKLFDPERQVEIFNPRKGTVMINVMEKLVIQKLDAAFQKFNSCKCDRCRQDVVALALNKLPPKYVIIAPDDIDDYISKQDDSAVTSSIIQAIFTVRTHPRH